MPCWKPSQMFEYVNTDTGEVFFRFKAVGVSNKVREIRSFQVGCGQCSGCRTKAARTWGVRCYHESLLHNDSCFITLTVEDKYLPFVFPEGSVRYEPFQRFIRSFRKVVGVPIRFFMCAEYGDQFQRPHYHAIIFGWSPSSSDRTLYRSCEIGNLYTSATLESVWTYGYSTVAYFHVDCALYVAGYIHKKINGRLKDVWYQGRTPEFAKMSNRPGIGAGFYKKYTSDLYRRDEVVLPGDFKFSLPRYYDKLHQLYHPGHMGKVKLKRMEPDPVRDQLNIPERLAARKVITDRRLSMKSRSFEK